jgi:hypothetical protein
MHWMCRDDSIQIWSRLLAVGCWLLGISLIFSRLAAGIRCPGSEIRRERSGILDLPIQGSAHWAIKGSAIQD